MDDTWFQMVVIGLLFMIIGRQDRDEQGRLLAWDSYFMVNAGLGIVGAGFIVGVIDLVGRFM